MKKCLKRFYRSTAGTTAIEYSLIASLIALGIIGSLMLAGSAVEGWYQTVVDAFPD